MDERLIDRWNDAVSPSDAVYHLGDFTLGDKQLASHYFQQLHGRIHILGNPWHHDRRWLTLYGRLGDEGSTPMMISVNARAAASLYSLSNFQVCVLPPLYVLEFHELGTGEHPLAITLCHYPLAEWDRKHYGAWHLYGHSHGKYVADGFALDVGVDANGYAPVLLADIVDRMMARGWELD